ncbi:MULTISPECIES: hypothetical protein [Thalassospira]|jgi:hypothetical protein|uniref:Uncharacterized protein n=1 Tax=Thalassospira lohafexi TaxID=744227 RepID=A0A2N3L1C1_9PROT|nr:MULTISPECIES: hypothetical protein [Thalassospira]PKR56592.1 hypothetical protein COO92_20400 [Thalassospira lohafexi]|tara:strand:- start:30852 stop:31499 length:648 start_codon:yes stop_codon:yes gene_type:complete
MNPPISNPIAVDILDPALITAISQLHEFNITKRTLYRLSESARDIGLQFVIGGGSFDLNDEQRDALARSLAYLHVSLNYSLCPDEWDKIVGERISDGWAHGVLFQLLDELAQANVHLADLSPSKIEQPWAPENLDQSRSEDNALDLPPSGNAWTPSLVRFFACVLGSFLGVLLGHWLSEESFAETSPQITFPAYPELSPSPYERMIPPVQPEASE